MIQILTMLFVFCVVILILFLLFNLLIDTNGNSSFGSIGLPSWGSSGDSGGAAV